MLDKSEEGSKAKIRWRLFKREWFEIQIINWHKKAATFGFCRQQ
jgi:hypothetical protein